MADGKIDPIAGGSNLIVDREAKASNGFGNGALEVGTRSLPRLVARSMTPVSAKARKPLEDPGADALGAIEVDVPGIEGDEDLGAVARAGEENIEAPFAGLRLETGPKAILSSRCPGNPWPVTDRDEDHVAFVALDVFQVLHEGWLPPSLAQEDVELVIFAASDLHEFGDQVTLGVENVTTPRLRPADLRACSATAATIASASIRLVRLPATVVGTGNAAHDQPVGFAVGRR